MKNKLPKLVKDDKWLEPFSETIINRIKDADKKEKEITGDNSLLDFASGHLYFGLHQTKTGWVIREWAPNATFIYLIGTFNNWQEEKEYTFLRLENGVWELKLDSALIQHQDLYSLSTHWAINYGKRIPAWATRVVQDSNTHIFNAQVWAPENPYQWNLPNFKRTN